MNRRQFFASSGAASAGALILTSCGATTQTVDTILTGIDKVASEAVSVLNSVETVLGGIAQPVFGQIDNYLVSVESACEQALALGQSGQPLTAAQVAQIVELFANLATAAIPGVPDAVKLALVAVEAAINTLLGFIKPQLAAVKRMVSFRSSSRWGIILGHSASMQGFSAMSKRLARPWRRFA